MMWSNYKRSVMPHAEVKVGFYVKLLCKMCLTMTFSNVFVLY